MMVYERYKVRHSLYELHIYCSKVCVVKYSKRVHEIHVAHQELDIKNSFMAYQILPSSNPMLCNCQ